MGTKGPYAYASLCSCVEICKLCHGRTQIIENDYARPCRKLSPIRICSLINAANIPARYTAAELKDFANQTGNCAASLAHIKKWVHSYSRQKEMGLLMSGPVGIGKTFLLAAIGVALARRGFKVKFIDFFQLISQIKASYAEHKSEQLILAPLIEVDVLIIDEMGKGRNTDFELTILDQLIMGRYNQQKTIVASTNCTVRNTPSHQQTRHNLPLDMQYSETSTFASQDFGTLESRVGNRIYSRLIETTQLIEITGHDFRKKRGSSWNAY